MPKTAKELGKRHRPQINENDLQRAIECIRNGMSQMQAAKRFNIDRYALFERLKDRDNAAHPEPISPLSKDLEQSIFNRLVKCADWCYPLDYKELRKIIAEYLEQNDIEVPQFKNNVPKSDYLHSFILRHEVRLSRCMCRNIQRSVTNVNYATIEEFFGNLSILLQGVPPQNIFCFEELNMRDNFKSKNLICRRRSKYVEVDRNMNPLKFSVSAMFAGNADGGVLPPYIVYKAAHLHDSWTQYGPHGARFNCTRNGWIDSFTFFDWMHKIMIPRLKKIEGNFFSGSKALNSN